MRSLNSSEVDAIKDAIMQLPTSNDRSEIQRNSDATVDVRNILSTSNDLELCCNFDVDRRFIHNEDFCNVSGAQRV